MKKQIIFFFLVSQILSNNCEVGCLLCDGSDCLYCDKEINYYRVGRICTKKILDNCDSSDNGETCTFCSEGYYADYTTGKCREATEDDLIENCRMYKLVKECIDCKDKFYLSNGSCIAVEQEITNCQVYASATTCQSCKDDFRLSDDKTQCIKIEFQNCAQIGNIKCHQCKTGYMYYQNAYLYNFNIWTNDKKKKMDIYNLQGEFYSICAKQNVAHCKTFEEFFQCSECEEGYFLTPDKQCEIIPEERINDCFEYLQLGKCRLCIEGFYLSQDLSQCFAHSVTVDLCKKMSETTKDICDECEDGYYIENNICVVRTLQIENCQTLQKDADACANCQDGYISNEGGSQCFKKIENCLTLTTTISEISCSQCISGYYFSSEQQKCQLTTGAKNCNKYKEVDGSPACTECLKNYYMLENGTCEAHSSFALNYLNCKAWSLEKKNTCSTCQTDEQKFLVLGYCNAVDILYYDENCVYYSFNQEKSQPTCFECKSGFYLDATTKKCFKISSVPNCSSYTDRCTGCQSSDIENYFLSSPDLENKCILSYTHVISNCSQRDAVETFDVSGTVRINYNTCNRCFSPFYPAYFKGVQFCIPRNRIVLNFDIKEDKKIYIDNCKNYKPEISDETERCVECTFDDDEQMVIQAGQCKALCASAEVILTKQYETSANDNKNFKAVTRRFVCETLSSEIYGAKRVSLLPQNQDITSDVDQLVDTSVIKVLECKTDFLPLLSIDSPYRYFDLLSYVPAKATQHFKSKNISYESKYNKATTFGSCKDFTEKEGASFQIDSFSGKQFYKIAYTPAQPVYSAGSDFWTNCRALDFNELGKYWCHVCKFGFTGFFLLEQDSNKPMIPQCRLNSDQCDYGVFYEGLHGYYAQDATILAHPDISQQNPQNLNASSFLDYWVTCHKCLTSGQIPTFVTGVAALIKMDAEGNSIHLFNSKTNHLLSEGTDLYLPQNFCDKVGFIRVSSTDDTVQNPDFPAHCGVQMLFQGKLLQAFNKNETELKNNNPSCVACKPGFKPEEIFYDNNLFIVDCIEITNCDEAQGKTTFNKCTQCALGYSLNEDDNKCVPNANNKQCYKVLGEDPANCVQCRKGYVPDKDKKYCNLIHLQNCLVEDFLTWTSVSGEVQYVGKGCTECDLGYIAVQFEYKQRVCVESTEIIQRVAGIGVRNCYIYSSYDRCYQCNVGFVVPKVISADGNVVAKFENTQCVLQSLIPNCKEYRIELNGANTVACSECTYPCIQCQNGFVLVNGQCEDGSKYITNCLIFAEGSSINSQSLTKCDTCQDGFIASELADGKIACKQISTKISKCEAFELKTITNNSGDNFNAIWCKLCETGFYPQRFFKADVDVTQNYNLLPEPNDTDNIDGVDTNYSIEICIGKPEIPNCESYNDESNCVVSAENDCNPLICRRCLDRYWLKQPSNNSSQIQQCILRTNYPYAYCDLANISVTQDNCHQCQDGYYLRDGQCQTKPRGVIGCVFYQDTDTCIKCKNNQYVEGNICKPVDEENLIENCLYYKDNFTCLDCNEGYLLIDNQCKAILISDCQTFETEVACKICKSQYFITESKTCEKGKVSNCLIHSTVETCQQCDAGYYVNSEKQCSQVSLNEEITNCLYYEASNLCKYCTNGALLSKDQKSCTIIGKNDYPVLFNEIDANCDSYLYDVHCKVCEPGYKFKDGVCSTCPPNLENCFFCDYYDDQVCHVCMSGFYQSEKKECISSGNQSADQQVDSDGGRTVWEYLKSMIFMNTFWIIFALIQI